MTLADFLFARIAEDEAGARAVVGDRNAWDTPEWDASRWSPWRVLDECQAKRRMVEYVVSVADQVDGEWGCGHGAAEIRWETQRGSCAGADELRAGLGILASVYSDHPDYRDEWRPNEWVR